MPKATKTDENSVDLNYCHKYLVKSEIYKWLFFPSGSKKTQHIQIICGAWNASTCLPFNLHNIKKKKQQPCLLKPSMQKKWWNCFGSNLWQLPTDLMPVQKMTKLVMLVDSLVQNNLAIFYFDYLQSETSIRSEFLFSSQTSPCSQCAWLKMAD